MNRPERRLSEIFFVIKHEVFTCCLWRSFESNWKIIVMQKLWLFRPRLINCWFQLGYNWLLPWWNLSQMLRFLFSFHTNYVFGFKIDRFWGSALGLGGAHFILPYRLQIFLFNRRINFAKEMVYKCNISACLMGHYIVSVDVGGGSQLILRLKNTWPYIWVWI